jgi:hypothetical protein
MQPLVSAWMLFCRLVQCIALFFFLDSMDWVMVEKGWYTALGIL